MFVHNGIRTWQAKHRGTAYSDYGTAWGANQTKWGKKGSHTCGKSYAVLVTISTIECSDETIGTSYQAYYQFEVSSLVKGVGLEFDVVAKWKLTKKGKVSTSVQQF